MLKKLCIIFLSFNVISAWGQEGWGGLSDVNEQQLRWARCEDFLKPSTRLPRPEHLRPPGLSLLAKSVFTFNPRLVSDYVQKWREYKQGQIDIRLYNQQLLTGEQLRDSTRYQIRELIDKHPVDPVLEPLVQTLKSESDTLRHLMVSEEEFLAVIDWVKTSLGQILRINNFVIVIRREISEHLETVTPQMRRELRRFSDDFLFELKTELRQVQSLAKAQESVTERLSRLSYQIEIKIRNDLARRSRESRIDFASVQSAPLIYAKLREWSNDFTDENLELLVTDADLRKEAALELQLFRRLSRVGVQMKSELIHLRLRNLKTTFELYQRYQRGEEGAVQNPVLLVSLLRESLREIHRTPFLKRLNLFEREKLHSIALSDDYIKRLVLAAGIPLALPKTPLAPKKNFSEFWDTRRASRSEIEDYNRKVRSYNLDLKNYFYELKSYPITVGLYNQRAKRRAWARLAYLEFLRQKFPDYLPSQNQLVASPSVTPGSSTSTYDSSRSNSSGDILDPLTFWHPFHLNNIYFWSIWYQDGGSTQAHNVAAATPFDRATLNQTVPADVMAPIEAGLGSSWVTSGTLSGEAGEWVTSGVIGDVAQIDAYVTSQVQQSLAGSELSLFGGNWTISEILTSEPTALLSAIATPEYGGGSSYDSGGGGSSGYSSSSGSNNTPNSSTTLDSGGGDGGGGGGGD